MAPKGAMKRPAAAVTTSAKKSRGEGLAPEIVTKCDSIAAALKDFETPPSGVRAVLSFAVKHSLSVYKDDRHEFQEVYVTQIGSLLEDLKKSMEEKKATYQTFVDNADTKKAELAEAEKEATSTLEGLVAAKTEAAAKSSADEEEVKTIKVAVAAAKKAQVDGDASFVSQEGKLKYLEAAYTETFLPMKEKAAQNQACLKVIEKVGKMYSFDPSMLASVYTVLKAEPEFRGQFGGMVVTQLEETFKKTIASLTTELEGLAPAKAERLAAVDAKEAEKTAAEEKASVSKEALEKAVIAQTEGEKDLAAKKKAVANFIPELKEAADNLDSATADYDMLMAGPMAAFAELKDLAPPPPPPVEPEPVAEPAPEVAAEAAPAVPEAAPEPVAEPAAAPVA